MGALNRRACRAPGRSGVQVLAVPRPRGGTLRETGLSMRKLSLAVVALAGCLMDEPLESPPEPISLYGAPLVPGTESQGRYLLGTSIDSLTSPISGELYSL